MVVQKLTDKQGQTSTIKLESNLKTSKFAVSGRKTKVDRTPLLVLINKVEI